MSYYDDDDYDDDDYDDDDFNYLGHREREEDYDDKHEPTYDLPSDIKNKTYDYTQLAPKLDKENYCDRQHNLLYIEEAENASEIYEKRRVDLDFKIKIEEDPEDIKENVEVKLYRVPSFRMGKHPLLKEGASVLVNGDISGTVYDIDKNYVWFDLKTDIVRNARRRVIIRSGIFPERILRATVIVTESRIPFLRCHKAVDNFARNRDFYSKILFPQPDGERVIAQQPKVASSFLLSSDFVNQRLNDLQRSAVRQILQMKARPAPFILFGPPGTGKTVTLVEAIVQVYLRSDCKILVCGNSNACAEMLAKRLFETGEIESDEMVRLVAESRLNTIRGSRRQIKEITVTMKEYEKRHDSIRILVCTCSQAGKLNESSEIMFARDFDYVFVDEAAHAHEAEVLIPTSFVNFDGCVVLAGDPYQLNPVCKSDKAKQYGLGTSFLTRLFKFPIYKKQTNAYGLREYDTNYIIKLLDCYRSDPRVMQPSNELFYESELVCKAETPAGLLRYLNVSKPLLLDKTFSPGQLEKGETSMYNRGEALKCLKWYRKLRFYGLKSKNMSIITNYKRQKDEICNLFRDVDKHVQVCTVDEFQGQECEAVIISTVKTYIGSRQNNLFLFDENRVNVAVSRAKWITIVLGDPTILNQSRAWRVFINNAQKVSTPFARKKYWLEKSSPRSRDNRKHNELCWIHQTSVYGTASNDV